METAVKKELIPLEARLLIDNALEYIGTITEITVREQAEYDNAVNLCKQIKVLSKRLDEERDGIVRPLNSQVKDVNAEFKTVTDKLDNGERRIKSAMSIWFQEQERKRIEAQRIAQAEADKVARIAAEKAAAERRKQEEYEAQGRQDMADKAAARAELQEDRAINTVAQVIETPKTAGVSFRSKFICSIENKRDVVEHCIKNPHLEHLVMINIKEIEKLADSTKGAMRIPGVSYVETKTPIIRA